jgi:AraC family transcriptional regulator
MTLKTQTLTDHARRIARAMAHLAERPDRTPSLEGLASVAASSPCHFHRAYRALAGETPAGTLARLRLSRAAAALLKTEAPIARVAREAGYGSVPAFTRAFREALGVPPAAYRARAGIGIAVKEDDREVIVTETPPMHLAVLPHTGPYEAIGPLFDRVMAWAGARGLIGPETRFIALSLDDLTSVPDSALRAKAGITVPPGTVLEPGMEAVGLPALRCARLRFQGPSSELEAAYDTLYGKWLPAWGEEPADVPCFEEYLNDCRTLPPAEWLTDIFLPLQRG